MTRLSKGFAVAHVSDLRLASLMHLGPIAPGNLSRHLEIHDVSR